ncbi:MAG: helix-turn-helix domain-containing protein [Gammaproteobacteria bacterium]
MKQFPQEGERFRQLRQEAGLRQVDLAARLERPQSYVSKYETGERRLDLIELKAICEAVGSSLGQLVERFENDGLDQ